MCECLHNVLAVGVGPRPECKGCPCVCRASRKLVPRQPVDVACCRIESALQVPRVLRQQRLLALRDAARGLAFLHAKEVVHRDVKAANILFDAGTSRAVLTDFGLVRDARREGGAACGS